MIDSFLKNIFCLDNAFTHGITALYNFSQKLYDTIKHCMFTGMVELHQGKGCLYFRL